jgi:gas vesicle protein
MFRLIALIAVGIVIGMLIAPDKGSVTRRKLNNLIDSFNDSENPNAEP